MSVDSNFNRQFIQIDFRLLDNPEFLQFVTQVEFATYLILRRYIWRGSEHRLGLHTLYAKQQKLACSISVERIAEMLGLKEGTTRVSRHLTTLCEIGVVERIRTGRENIFVLGEWHRPRGWHVSKEFYYLENRFGIPGGKSPKTRKSDLSKNDKSDLQNAQDQTGRKTAGQTRRKTTDSNREENREVNTVGNGLQNLPNQGLQTGEIEYVAQEILDQLGDEHSRRFYRLVAAKVPEQVIRKALAEIKTDGANSPAKVFTFRMTQYALKRLRSQIGDWQSAA